MRGTGWWIQWSGAQGNIRFHSYFVFLAVALEVAIREMKLMGCCILEWKMLLKTCQLSIICQEHSHTVDLNPEGLNNLAPMYLADLMSSFSLQEGQIDLTFYSFTGTSCTWTWPSSTENCLLPRTTQKERQGQQPKGWKRTSHDRTHHVFS